MLENKKYIPEASHDRDRSLSHSGIMVSTNNDEEVLEAKV